MLPKELSVQGSIYGIICNVLKEDGIIAKTFKIRLLFTLYNGKALIIMDIRI